MGGSGRWMAIIEKSGSKKDGEFSAAMRRDGWL